ncbi:transposase [Nocardia gipuzkoensis]|uniref:TrkA C-terminal domain-containing protein n=1 Tax=Nocardia gipuzkoensis TaxID=2749991 RepID=UPI001E43020F|nr:TrkA C-terminal domain-containing protein [Nocardia gipuzkoensis]UGT67732.1 transposase [Nocardia gipuzkoensis]
MAAPRKYPDELRARAVRLYRESDPKPTIRKLAEQLGVHHDEFDADYAMAKTVAPKAAIGKTLTASALRQHFDITVVAIKHRGGQFTYATADTVVAEGDQLIVSGRIEEVERFADLT